MSDLYRLSKVRVDLILERIWFDFDASIVYNAEAKLARFELLDVPKYVILAATADGADVFLKWNGFVRDIVNVRADGERLFVTVAMEPFSILPDCRPPEPKVSNSAICSASGGSEPYPLLRDLKTRQLFLEHEAQARSVMGSFNSLGLSNAQRLQTRDRGGLKPPKK
jgi:hypothetical protein